MDVGTRLDLPLETMIVSDFDRSIGPNLRPQLRTSEIDFYYEHLGM